MALLNTHADGNPFIEILHEVFLHGIFDTLKLVPFLFLTYLLMEFIEHHGSDKAECFMQRAGRYAPIVGGALGAIPQCGFSAAAANLYAGKIISIGTIVAIFLSTSDEMLPILISGDIPISTVFLIVIYKALVGIIVGLCVDLVIRITSKKEEKINIDAICDEDNCHCERGIFYSALHHTLTISLFVLLITLSINALIFFIGEDALASILYDKPVISHIIAAIFGLIPNCAASVALATLCAEGLITAGTMMAGLFSGAGVGLLVLFRVNKHLKKNLVIVGVILVTGIIFGLIGDLIFPAHLFV